MKKLLVTLGLLSVCFTFADKMPKGSPQAQAAQALAEIIPNLTLEPCPPERDVPTTQATCATFVDVIPPFFMDLVDTSIPAHNVRAKHSPDVKPLPLEPQTETWLYHPSSKGFERSYTLEKGTYRIIYAPDWKREPSELFEGEVTMFYTP